MGHFGALAAEAIVGGQNVPVCWGRDLIVAPEARRLGAGPLLIMTAVRAAARPFMVAGLNDESHALFRGLGFLERATLPLYVGVRGVSAFIGSMQGVWNRVRGTASPYSVTRLERFDDEYDRRWESLERAFGCVIRRTSRTMQWRYQEHPFHQYQCLAVREGRELRGIVVLRCGRSRGRRAGFISELLAHPRDRCAVDTLLAHAVDFFAASQHDSPVFVRCSIRNRAFERALRRSGFVPVPSPIRWMMIHPDGPSALGPLSDPDRWLLTGGDADLDMS